MIKGVTMRWVSSSPLGRPLGWALCPGQLGPPSLPTAPRLLCVGCSVVLAFYPHKNQARLSLLPQAWPPFGSSLFSRAHRVPVRGSISLVPCDTVSVVAVRVSAPLGMERCSPRVCTWRGRLFLGYGRGAGLLGQRHVDGSACPDGC